jgi:molybdate/tungstate transport system permease protein
VATGGDRPGRGGNATGGERSSDGGRPGWRGLALLLGGVLLLVYGLPLATLVVGRSPASLLASVRDPAVTTAATTTLLSATVSTAVAVVLGIPLGYWLARTDSRAKSGLTALVAFPLVLPPVVSGMLLVAAFGGQGLGGLVGVSATRTFAGVVLAQVFVASPFVVLSARSAFAGVNRTVEEAAATLGASEWRTFRQVTLPLAGRGILAGITLAFARAAGEFGATLMVAYFPRTLPVQIRVAFQTGGLDAAFPVAVVLVAVSLVALGAINVLGGSRLVGV